MRTQNTFSAGGIILTVSSPVPAKPLATPLPSPPLTTNSQPQQATRIKVILRETQDIPFPAGLESVVAVSAEIATVQVKNGRFLTVTGIKVGETILLISDKQKRFTMIIQVIGKPATTERQNKFEGQNKEGEHNKTSGSVNLAYSAGFNGNPSLVRQNVEVQHKLSKDRTLRISGEMFKVIQNEADQSFTKAQEFGLNRLSVGIDSKDKTIDFLDSQVNISPLSLNGYTMRGFHFISTPNSSPSPNSFEKGVEFFAGSSRPSLAFYDEKQGWVAGAMVPVIKGKSWQVRAGAIVVSPEKNNRSGKGGTVFQVTGKFAPSDKFSADGEAAYADDSFSWRARADLKLGQINAFGEIIRLDKNSPLSRIGAQPDGNKTESLAISWRPISRFGVSLNYNHREVGRLQNSSLISFDRSNFSAKVNYKVSRNSSLTLRFLDQKIETLISGSSSKIKIENRSLTIGNNTRFNEHWTNNFEARMSLSREAGAKTELENGFDLREQLRFSFAKTSISAFLNYAYKTPSLTSLIVRNPQLLPPVLQSAFTLDTTRFLQFYQDRLASLVPSLDLPQTRNLDAGVNFQTSFSRFTVNAETRYTTGEILSQNRKSMLNTIGVNIRLDEANSVQINGTKSFGESKLSSLTFSYTHTFGRGNKESFRFSKLLGFDRGKVQGRVYHDLNGNGQDDLNEPGIAGMTIQIDEKRSIKTDFSGRYTLSISEGDYKLTMVSPDLGVKLRATSPTQIKVFLSSGENLKISFGVSDFGFVSGQILNDLTMTGKSAASNLPGVSGVKMKLRSTDSNSTNVSFDTVTAGNGVYEFQNLRPGEYTLELDTETLPPNFQLPKQTIWLIKVVPLQGFYFDVFLETQRSVAGIIFIDKNRNGQFDSNIDQIIEGATINTDNQSAVSDQNGAYILRNLPAGKIKLFARSPQEAESSPVVLEFGADPATKRGINFIVNR